MIEARAARRRIEARRIGGGGNLQYAALARRILRETEARQSGGPGHAGQHGEHVAAAKREELRAVNHPISP